MPVTAARDVDVLIVGYGPVGAALAGLLGQYGVRTLVIDKLPNIWMSPRAVTLDNEALRILQTVGLGPDAFPRVPIPCIRMHSPYFGEFARINTAGTIGGHPKLVTLYQPDVERALRANADRGRNVEAWTGVEMLDFSEEPDGVRVKVRTADGAEIFVRTRYLVGADGASSAVRTAIGAGFKGKTYSEQWLIVDAVGVPSPIDHVEFLCNPARPVPHMVAPGDRTRWEFMLMPGERPEEMEKDAKIAELIRPWARLEDVRIERKAVYRFHARSCTHFSRGRVFLVGDAAHLTPPFAGQGLAAGLRDAVNLGWKLAWVIRGRASAAILESYDQERRPHAVKMIALARRTGWLVAPCSRLRAWIVHGAIALARKLPLVRYFIDELGIKPANAYADGLFRSGPGGFVRGAWFPQGRLRNADGDIRLSDDALGPRFALVVLGARSAPRLAADVAAGWAAVGGAVVEIAKPGTQLRPGTAEDVDRSFASAPSGGWCVVVRPDRTILHDGPLLEADRIVRESVRLLAPMI